jgi:hypothetical protein
VRLRAGRVSKRGPVLSAIGVAAAPSGLRNRGVRQLEVMREAQHPSGEVPLPPVASPAGEGGENLGRVTRWNLLLK